MDDEYYNEPLDPANLDRFVRLEKDFIGRDALAAKYGADGPGSTVKLCTWTVDTAPGRDGFDVIGDEPIWRGGDLVGAVTSGGYAHWSGVSVACGYAPRALAEEEGGWEIEILGERRPAMLQRRPLFDPEGAAMRG